VIDCFLFFNELELLEVRLHELAGVVDTFVLVESAQTFTGLTKPLHFAENRARFDGFPIVSITIPAFPSHLGSAWDREAFSRNVLKEGLMGLDLAPVDEIPRAACIERIVQEAAGEGSDGRNASGTVCQRLPAVLVQDFFYYYFDCQVPESWKGTRLTRYGSLGSFDALRRVDGPTIGGGGWHFSYLGGVERIQNKIAAFSHSELNRPEFTSESHVASCLALGTDLFGRSMRFTFRGNPTSDSNGNDSTGDNARVRDVAIPDDLPDFVLSHVERFAHLFHRYCR
jgi:hypothetical protein